MEVCGQGNVYEREINYLLDKFICINLSETIRLKVSVKLCVKSKMIVIRRIFTDDKSEM